MVVFFSGITCGQHSRQSFLAPRIFGYGLLLVCKRYDGIHTFCKIQFRISGVYLPFLVLGYVGPWYSVRKHNSLHVPIESNDIFNRSTLFQFTQDYKATFIQFTCPGGAPFKSLIGLYGVVTLSIGAWAEVRLETAALIIFILAIAVFFMRMESDEIHSCCDQCEDEKINCHETEKEYVLA